jgi:hypothetical protein
MCSEYRKILIKISFYIWVFLLRFWVLVIFGTDRVWAECAHQPGWIFSTGNRQAVFPNGEALMAAGGFTGNV